MEWKIENLILNAEEMENKKSENVNMKYNK
jgi:hypothetical protein